MAELITGFSSERELESKQLEVDSSQFLTFIIAERVFGLAIVDVEEIIESGNISDVPMTADYIRGVINLRGQVVTVIDLAPRITNVQSTLSKLSCIVMINTDSGLGLLGLLVDEVHQIVDIPPEQVQPPPKTADAMQTDVIQALGRVEEEFVMILDTNRLLSTEQMEVVNQINQSEPPS